MGGDGDHRRRQGQVAELAQNRKPIQLRHLDVDHHQVGVEALEQFQRYGSIAGLDHLVAAAAQDFSDKLQAGGIVLGDQDGLGQNGLGRH